MRPVLIDYYADYAKISKAFKSILTDRQRYSLLKAVLLKKQMLPNRKHLLLVML